jgi:hypothetical protein
MEQYTAWNKLTFRFILENPPAVPRLLFYKTLRIFTSEPYAESVSLEKGRSYKLKRWVTFVERWFILIAGTVGLFSMWRSRHPRIFFYLLFTLGGLINIVVGYTNARFFLPVAISLMVPATIAIENVIKFLESRS